MSEERLKRAREVQLAKYEAMIVEYMAKGTEPPHECLFWVDMMALYQEGIKRYQEARE